MTILVSGGGTGGHITPLLAVAHELKKLLPSCQIIYVGERGGKFKHLIEADSAIDQQYYISAGKFRRYHGESVISKLIDFKTFALNVRDFFRFIAGRWQSKKLMKKLQPDVVFVKGGFVGVPVGLAATRRKIPVVTHDSDTTPGLANKILANKAKAHATGMPAELYSYPKDKTYYTGIPVASTYTYVDTQKQQAAKKQLGIPAKTSLIVVTGGSQGAQSLNSVISSQHESILGINDSIWLIHQVGRGNMSPGLHQRRQLQQVEFLDNLSLYTAAADLVICRASATTIAELGVQGKAIILVPSPFLAGGHQLKNAEYIEAQQAAIVLQEAQLGKQPEILTNQIQQLLHNEDKRQKLGENLHKSTKKDAAHEIAQLLISVGEDSI